MLIKICLIAQAFPKMIPLHFQENEFNKIKIRPPEDAKCLYL